MAVPTTRAVGTVAAANAAAISPGLPAGTVAGDLLIMFLNSGPAETITASGWTATPSSPQANGGVTGTNKLTILYKVAAGSDATTTSTPTAYVIGRIIAITTGTFDVTTPFNTSAGDFDDTVDTAITVPGGTTTRADCLIVAAAGVGLPDANTTTTFSAFANASLSSVVDLINNTTSQGNGGGIGVLQGGLATAGVYGASTMTVTTATASTHISLAVQPPITTQSLTGSLFTKAPTFFTGVVTPGVVALTGTLFTKAPSFFTGTVFLAQALTGTLFVKAPTFFTGTVTSGAVTLTGTLFTKAPTFPQGAITTGAVSLTGILFQKAPTFPTGTVTASVYPLTGVLFQRAPTFFAGTIGQAGTLFGNLFVNTPVFFIGTMGYLGGSFWRPNPVGYTLAPVGYTPIGPGDVPPWGIDIEGVVFVKAPVFPVGTVS